MKNLFLISLCFVFTSLNAKTFTIQLKYEGIPSLDYGVDYKKWVEMDPTIDKIKVKCGDFRIKGEAFTICLIDMNKDGSINQFTAEKIAVMTYEQRDIFVYETGISTTCLLKPDNDIIIEGNELFRVKSINPSAEFVTLEEITKEHASTMKASHIYVPAIYPNGLSYNNFTDETKSLFEASEEYTYVFLWSNRHDNVMVERIKTIRALREEIGLDVNIICLYCVWITPLNKKEDLMTMYLGLMNEQDGIADEALSKRLNQGYSYPSGMLFNTKTRTLITPDVMPEKLHDVLAKIK